LWELLPLLVVAMGTSCLGSFLCTVTALLTKMHNHCCNSRFGKRRTTTLHLMEVVIVCLGTISACYWIAVSDGCRPLDLSVVEESEDWKVGVLTRTVCPEGQYSDFGTLLLQPRPTAIQALFTHSFQNGATIRISRLLISCFIALFLTAFTYASTLPMGLWAPNFLIGATFGRAI
ncbi:unnamed protein product, partial [Polarella glacialis]